MDIFHEYIVTKKKELKDYLITLLLIGAAIVLTFVFAMLTMMYSQYLSSIGLLLIVGVWWGAVYLIKARNVEFEYILTNNEIDIDKIAARRARKRMCTINLKEIELCASINDARFKHEYENAGDRSIKNYAGDITGERVYFIDFTMEAERTRVIFQPGDRMLSAMARVNPRLVHVKDGDVTVL